MKRITEDEFAKMRVKRSGRVYSNPVLSAVRELRIGGLLFVSTEDWKIKTKPGVLITGATRDGSKFSTRSVEGGWVVKRIK